MSITSSSPAAMRWPSRRRWRARTRRPRPRRRAAPHRRVPRGPGTTAPPRRRTILMLPSARRAGEAFRRPRRKRADCSSSWRARSMKLLVKLMVVVLVALLSVPALAGRGSSGRSGGFSHSGAHFSSGRHFVSGGHFLPGRRVFRSTTVFVGVGVPFFAYYPPPLPYYYDYPPAYYPASPQQCYWYFFPTAIAY